MRLCESLYERLYTSIPSALLSNDGEAHSDRSFAPEHIHAYYCTYIYTYICLYVYIYMVVWFVVILNVPVKTKVMFIYVYIYINIYIYIYYMLYIVYIIPSRLLYPLLSPMIFNILSHCCLGTCRSNKDPTLQSLPARPLDS